MRRATWIGGVLAVAIVLGLSSPAAAVITRLTALSDVIEEATFIFVARVDTLDAERPAMVLTAEEALKGKPAWKKLPVLLEGDKRAAKLKERPDLLARLEAKLPLVLFVNRIDKEYAGIAFTNGTWFSLNGVAVDGEVRWALTHLEPYLRRTYAGTTAELTRIVRDAVAGKGKPPAPDAKAKPGLGPKVKKEGKKTGLIAPHQPPALGVIPTVLVGGPLAMLAMLFPAVFGGWKRWLVLLSTAGTTSTLLTLHWWYNELLVGTWWGNYLVLWTSLTAVYVYGLCWAWQRHLQRVQFGEAPLLAGKVELLLLGAVSLLGGGMVAALRVMQQPLFSNEWLPVFAFVVALWAGTAYVTWTWLRGPRIVPALATETVVLTALALVSVGFTPFLPGRSAARTLGGELALGGGGTTSSGEKTRVELVWSFRLPEKGAIASSPVAVGERVFIAAAHDSVFRPYGAVYCLDRGTGSVLWKFDDGKKMKQVFSTPRIVGGRLYVGEGFHQDSECKVYCLDAGSGKKLAEFETASHTEASPAVSGGRLDIGAGDDGLYCLDAASLQKVWNFPSFHIDASPALAGDRVYAGCGIGDVFKTTAVLCLDAKEGKQVWRYPTELPVWSRPIVSGGHLYAGTGNGRLNESDERPAGAVVCLRADSGEPVWKQKMPDGVLGRMGIDQKHLYFGCRDGHFYCVRRSDGERVWRRDLGGPVVTGPAMESCSCCERPPERMYVASVDGMVACLKPDSGEVVWQKDLVERAKTQVEVISTPALEVREEKGRAVRRLYVGLTQLSSARVGELLCYEERAE